MSYTVVLYDKDMDFYEDVMFTPDKDKAITVCRAIYVILKNHYVLNKEHKTCGGLLPYEQFDWVQVFDHNNKCIFVNNEEYVD